MTTPDFLEHSIYLEDEEGSDQDRHSNTGPVGLFLGKSPVEVAATAVAKAQIARRLAQLAGSLYAAPKEELT